MGRPREFDIDEAVKAATDLFWRKGYEGTSLSDLTGAMRITAPSFYFAFGNKEKLFRKVIEHYHASQMERFEKAIREPTVRGVAERFLNSSADILTSPSHAPGCLALNSALPCAEGDMVRVWLANLRGELIVKLRKRFAQAGTGELPVHTDPDALARVVVIMTWGMAIEAQSGAKRKDLRRAIAALLAAWPPGTKRGLLRTDAVRERKGMSTRSRSRPS